MHEFSRIFNFGSIALYIIFIGSICVQREFIYCRLFTLRELELKLYPIKV